MPGRNQLDTDVVLIGAGIMSATLATLLRHIEPTWRITVLERLDNLALESSNAWNNAGTGHSALCELNYTPARPDGSVDISKAITVNEQFQLSRQFWSALVDRGTLGNPDTFIHSIPHISLVWGADDCAYMATRHRTLASNPLFHGLQYSDDPAVISTWAPAVTRGRDPQQPIAATYSADGTDVDFGEITKQLIATLNTDRDSVRTGVSVDGLQRRTEGGWNVTVRGKRGHRETLSARFVFVGAGGGALGLLQQSGIPEIRGYAGFPVSGQFLRADAPEIATTHTSKVYGKASVGAPPMSVPHLDTRIVEGSTSLMFGPYAGFTPKFLKHGSWLDLFCSIRPHNLLPMITVGVQNISLVRYLIREVFASSKKRFAALQEYMPEAAHDDWRLINAGQRVQVIKPTGRGGGTLQFGTELITAADGSIAGLLGASPGASTATAVMLNLLRRCFPDRIDGWTPQLQELIPSYGTTLADDPARAQQILDDTAATLRLTRATTTGAPDAR